jgi:SAM-dependent methyltransferase
MRHPGTVRSAYSRSTTEATNGYLDDNLRPTEKRGGEFRFFIQAARQYGSPVLELASGAGRMLMVLAEAGFDVYGLETSRPMMQLAQRAIGHRREHSRIRLIRGDMFRFAFSRKFPLIIVPYSTFWFNCDLATPKRCRHLGHETAHEACERKREPHTRRLASQGLVCIVDALLPGGAFIIDDPIRDPDCARQDERWWGNAGRRHGFTIAFGHPYRESSYCVMIARRRP